MTFDSRDTASFTAPRVLFGLGLVVFGVVLLFDRLNLVDAAFVFRFWPVIMIAIGLQQFFTPRTGANGERLFPATAVVWMTVGGVFLLNSLGIMRASVWSLFWPAVLIAVGIRLMGGKGLRLRTSVRQTYENMTSSADMGPIVAVLSGVKRLSAPVTYTGSEVTVFMGGAHIDLRQAQLARGSEAVIDLFAVMGGCELVLPADWVVSAPVVAIMGGVDDKRLMAPPTVIDQAMGAAAPPRLVIRGVVFLGGVTIRS